MFNGPTSLQGAVAKTIAAISIASPTNNRIRLIYSISFLFAVAFYVRNYGLGTQSSDQLRSWLSRIERMSLQSTNRLNLRAQSATKKGPAAPSGSCRHLYSRIAEK